MTSRKATDDTENVKKALMLQPNDIDDDYDSDEDYNSDYENDEEYTTDTFMIIHKGIMEFIKDCNLQMGENLQLEDVENYINIYVNTT